MGGTLTYKFIFLVYILRNNLSLNKWWILLWSVVVDELVNLVMSSSDGVCIDCVVDVGYVLGGGGLDAVLEGCYWVYILLELLWYLVLCKILKIIATCRLIKLTKLFLHNIGRFRSNWCLIALILIVQSLEFRITSCKIISIIWKPFLILIISSTVLNRKIWRILDLLITINALIYIINEWWVLITIHWLVRQRIRVQ